MASVVSERAAVPDGPRRVVVGVSGSIAAYKAPTVIRLLRQAGHEVKVVATQAALRFIGAPALAAVSGGAVSTGVFDDPAAVEHVGTAQWADLVLVAPASADLLARVAAGRADDLLTATILTATAPVVLAPAMHTQMWLNPATVENVATLRRRGLRVIDPDSGRLTGEDSGLGRLPDPEQVVAQALAVLAESDQTGAGQVLAGRHVVVSAGGTREPIDPVRYLGNRSSGRQGVAIAAEAARLGARVTLVAANIEAEVLRALPARVEVVQAPTALELREAVRCAAVDADVVVMAAAVADYRPAQVRASKVKKHSLHQGTAASAGAGVSIELVENPDVLAELVSDPPRREGRALVVGFAAETGDDEGDVLAHGAAKARRKGADLLAVNAVGQDRGFGDVPNHVVILNREGEPVAEAGGSKTEVARALMGLVAARLDPPAATCRDPHRRRPRGPRSGSRPPVV